MSTTRESVPALVIGSGFGGSVAALRLGLAGIETVVLERGRRWPVTDRQDTFCTYRQPDGRAMWLSEQTALFDPKPVDKHVGLQELHVEDGISVISLAGVGGGSLVYNTVLLRPFRKNFERIFPAVDYDEMGTFYDRVDSVIRPESIPDDVLADDHYLAARVFLEQCEKVGIRTDRLKMGTDWSAIRREIAGELPASAIEGEIWYGINSGAKKSLDRNYLPQAEATGKVHIRDLHNVTAVREDGEGGYVVAYDRIDHQGTVVASSEIATRRLFLAAGTMGTAKLLVKSKGRGHLPQLNEHVGRYWGANGDTFATRQAGRYTNGGRGGPASVVAFAHEDEETPTTMIVFPEWDAPEDTLTTLGMGFSPALGHFTYDAEHDRAVLHCPAEESATVIAAANRAYARLDAAVWDDHEADPSSDHPEFHGHYSGVPHAPAKAKAHAKTEAAAGLTAHPLGGAVMGKACDMYGRIQGYPGLYVVDGAFIPGCTAACNPAYTIAAFAERSLERILAEDFPAA